MINYLINTLIGKLKVVFDPYITKVHNPYTLKLKIK